MARKSKRETTNRNSAADANVEPHSGNAAYAANRTSRVSTPCSVIVTHVRSRLADPDGVSIKAVLDAIVQNGILADDSAKQIKEVRHRQVKGPAERTIIEIETEE